MGTVISETKLMDKWAASKRTQVSAILCIKLLPLLENALKLNFKALYETENLDPLQGPTHTLTPSSIHTQNRPQKLRMDLPPALLTCRLQPKTHCHPQKQRFGYPRLSKKIPRTPTKTDSSQGQFPKGQPTPCKTRDAFPRSPLGYRVLATHLLPLTSPVQLPNQPNLP